MRKAYLGKGLALGLLFAFAAFGAASGGCGGFDADDCADLCARQAECPQGAGENGSVEQCTQQCEASLATAEELGCDDEMEDLFACVADLDDVCAGSSIEGECQEELGELLGCAFAACLGDMKRPGCSGTVDEPTCPEIEPAEGEPCDGSITCTYGEGDTCETRKEYECFGTWELVPCDTGACPEPEPSCPTGSASCDLGFWACPGGCAAPAPSCPDASSTPICEGGTWTCPTSCPPDCIGGEFVVENGNCTCRYYQCDSPQPECPGASCLRDEWVCLNDGSCGEFEWGAYGCETGLVCEAGTWSCPPAPPEGFDACKAAAGLEESATCAGCSAVMTFDECSTEHLCEGSSGIYSALNSCVCAEGACADACPASCGGAGENTTACTDCATETCGAELTACAADA